MSDWNWRCRVCYGKIIEKKWYFDENIKIHRRTCCHGFPSTHEEVNGFKKEISITTCEKRIKILKDAISCASPQ